MMLILLLLSGHLSGEIPLVYKKDINKKNVINKTTKDFDKDIIYRRKMTLV